MKQLKSFSFLLAVIMFLTILVTPLLAGQEAAAGQVDDIGDYFATVPGLAALVLLLTQFFRKNFNLEGIYAQLSSWLVALALSTAGYLLKIGIFIDVQWYWIFIYAAASGLIANGLFEWKHVKSILELLMPRKNRTAVK